MVKALVFFSVHGLSHFIDHGCTMTVLEGPHAPQVKDAYAVTIAQDMNQVRLKTGHGAQLAVDEGDPSFFGVHSKVCK
jgi:hypothetical protein